MTWNQKPKSASEAQTLFNNLSLCIWASDVERSGADHGTLAGDLDPAMSSKPLPYSMKDVHYDNAKFRHRSFFKVLRSQFFLTLLLVRFWIWFILGIFELGLWCLCQIMVYYLIELRLSVVVVNKLWFVQVLLLNCVSTFQNAVYIAFSRNWSEIVVESKSTAFGDW